MIAELRAVVYLNKSKHICINLISSHGEKMVDGTSRKDETSYAWEVACVTNVEFLARARETSIDGILRLSWC